MSQPEYATELGEHRFDAEVTDYSPEARKKRFAQATQFRDKLKQFDDISKLTGANQVDVRILRDEVESEIFNLTELKEADWNPLVYNQSLANGLYLLVARDFAPAEQRSEFAQSFGKNSESDRAGKEEPAASAARAHGNRHRANAGRNRFGARRFGPASGTGPALKNDIAPVQEKAAKALEDYKSGWRKIFPRSDGDFRLGADKFRKNPLRPRLRLSMEEVMKRAQADLDQTQRHLRNRVAAL
jgi:hypothetical protein